MVDLPGEIFWDVKQCSVNFKVLNHTEYFTDMKEYLLMMELN